MRIPKELPFEQVNALALGQYPALLFTWFPNGTLVDAKQEFAIGDLAGTAGGKDGGSVKVNIRTGAWAEMNGGEPFGRDAISLYAWAFCGGDRVRACKELGASLGVPGCHPPKGAEVVPFPVKNPPREAPKEDWRPMVPPPDGVPGPNVNGWDHVFIYRDQAGKLLRYVVRKEARDGEKKKVRPLTYGYLKNDDYRSGKTGWHWKQPASPRSLYGLERLDGRPVIVQEGELKTDQVQALLPGYACLSLTVGSGGKNHNDLKPLAGLAVILVPDNDHDGGGRNAMREVARQLRELGATVQLIDTTGYPDGWDLGDAVKEGWDAARLEAFLKERAVDDLADPESGDDLEGDEDGEDGPDKPHREKWERAPLPLGFERNQCFYLSPMTGQVKALTPAQHTKLELMALADLNGYWMRQPIYENGKDGVDWEKVAARLMMQCAMVGPYNPDLIRGRGAWLEDDGRPVLHLGEHLMVGGERHQLMLSGSRYVYEAALRMDQAVAEPLKSSQAAELFEICKLFRWDKPISARLIAGWLVVAPICGALRWRPSIWVTGGSGSGKSTLETRVVRPVLGSIGRRVQGGTTEAGIRQLLGTDARPVVFDEAEAENAHAKSRIQSILDLVRQSSSEGGAEIVKGTQGQNGVKRYHIRSCFMFSSINVTLEHLADESRVTVLELLNAPRHDAQAQDQFDALLARIEATMTPDWCAGLVARSVWLMPVILKNAATFARAVATHLGSARVGDQIGTMLAGAYALTSSKEISAEDALAWVKDQEWEDTTSACADPDEMRLLNYLMQSRVRLDLGGGKFMDRTLSEIVKYATGAEECGAVAGLAQAELKRLGLAWDDARRGVWVSNTHTALKDRLDGTPWSAQWARTLRRLPGAEALARDAAAIRFTGERGRATFLPLDLIE